MRLQVSRLFLASLAFWTVAAAAAEPAIVGTWLGESICVDRARAPACNDERVRLVFREAKASVVHLDAQKLVGSTYETMFEIDLVPDGGGGGWVHDFETRSGLKVRWMFRVVPGGELEGRLLERPSNTPAREVKARRG